MTAKKSKRAWVGDRLPECILIVYDLMVEAPIRIAERVIADAEKAGMTSLEIRKTLQHMITNSLLYEFEAVLDMRSSVSDTERSESYVKCKYLAASATRVVNKDKQLVPLVTAVNNGVPINVLLPTLYRKRKRKPKSAGNKRKTAAVLQQERDASNSMHSSKASSTHH